MLWTPAHFWALAILLKDDYASVGIPMLPSVKGSALQLKLFHVMDGQLFYEYFGVLALPEGGFFI